MKRVLALIFSVSLIAGCYGEDPPAPVVTCNDEGSCLIPPLVIERSTTTTSTTCVTVPGYPDLPCGFTDQIPVGCYVDPDECTLPGTE